MEWLQVLTLFLANAGLILWFRAESREDWRHMDNKLDQFRLESKMQCNVIEENMKEFRERWFQESKDFHAKLCEIESNRKK